MRSLLLLLACPLSAFCQTVTMPQTVPVAINRLAVVEMTYDGDDFKYTVPPELDAFREYTSDPKQVRLRVIGYQAGMHRIVAVTCKGAKLSEFGSSLVIVGTSPPGPGPLPPLPPTPPVPPDPTPAGPRIVLLIRETADTTPALAALINQLRTGPPSQYLKSKGHNLLILDDDSLGGDGKPSVLVEQWRPHFKDLNLPAVLVIRKASDGSIQVVSKETLPPTADAVIDLVKKSGG